MAVRRKMSMRGKVCRTGLLLLSWQQMQTVHISEGMRERQGKGEEGG